MLPTIAFVTTNEILSGILGLPAYEIGKLHDDKVVGGPR